MEYTDLLPLADYRDDSEADLLCFVLDRARVAFAWKTGGLDAEALRRPLPPSTMTLAGLVKHMASVEAGFAAAAAGRTPGPPWDAVDREADPDCDWHTALTDEPEDLYALWYDAVARSRATWAELIADGGLDAVAQAAPDESWTVRRRGLLFTVLEEYLKHTGHADLLRESIDGLTGNDPPQLHEPT